MIRTEIQRRADILTRLPEGENPFQGDLTYLTWEPPKELPLITPALPQFLQSIYDQTTEDLRRLTSDGSKFLAYHVRQRAPSAPSKHATSPERQLTLDTKGIQWN